MSAPTDTRERLTLAVLACSALAFAVSQTMVVPALPAIGRELEVSTATVSWLLTGFLISAAIAPPILGRLGDMYGKQRLLAVTLGLFAAGAALCALARSIGPLIAGRVVMGAGGAIFPLAFGILRDELRPARIAGSIGLIAATFGIGGAAGTVISGLVVDALGYRALFWLILAVGAAALAVVARFIPRSPVRSGGRVDWIGAVLLAGSLVALLLAVSKAREWGWGSGSTIGLLAVAALAGAAWGVWLTRATDAIVDLRLLSHRPLLATNASSLLAGFAMFATFLAVTVLVQAPEATGYGFGASVTAAGLFLTPAAVAMLIGAPMASVLAARRSPRSPLLAGALVIAAALSILTVEHGSRPVVYLAMGLFGVGIGLSFAAQGSLTVACVAPHQTGAAGGLNTVIRTVGGALGGQIAASMLAGEPFPTSGAFTAVFALATVAAVAAWALALAVPARPAPA